MKILIAGANGFFGAHLIRALIDQGGQAIAGVRPKADLWRLHEVRKKITLTSLDVTSRESIFSAIEKNKPDVVINCAAYGVNFDNQDLDQALQVNVCGAVNLLEISRGLKVPKFVHIGSCSEYGHKDHPVQENESLEPSNVYASTKASATLLVTQLSRQNNYPAIVLRPFGMWGALEGAYRLAPQVVRACMLRTELELTPGEQIRDYTHVEDMAKMALQLLRTEAFVPGDIINLGSGQPISLREYVIKIARALGGEDLMSFGKKAYRYQEMMRVVADVRKLESMINISFGSEDRFVQRVEAMKEDILESKY